MSSGGALIRLNFATRSVLLAANLLSLEALLFDPLKGEFIAAPLSLSGGGSASVQRSVTASPIAITPSDQRLNCNIPGPALCHLPASASRNGVPLTFKNMSQNAANTIQFLPNGAELIDGANTLTVAAFYAGVTLVPFADGVNTGWSIQ